MITISVQIASISGRNYTVKFALRGKHGKAVGKCNPIRVTFPRHTQYSSCHVVRRVRFVTLARHTMSKLSSMAMTEVEVYGIMGK